MIPPSWFERQVIKQCSGSSKSACVGITFAANIKSTASMQLEKRLPNDEM